MSCGKCARKMNSLPDYRPIGWKFTSHGPYPLHKYDHLLEHRTDWTQVKHRWTGSETGRTFGLEHKEW